MPKYWGKQIFSLGSFPEMGLKQKTEKKREERLNDGDNNGQATHGARKPPRPKERLNDGINNGQAIHGACKHAWRTQAAWAKTVNISQS